MKIPRTLPPEEHPAIQAVRELERRYMDLYYTMKVCITPDPEVPLFKGDKIQERYNGLITRVNHINKLMEMALARAEGWKG